LYKSDMFYISAFNKASKSRDITLTWWWQIAENVWFKLFNFKISNFLALDYIIINNKIDYIYLVRKNIK